MSEKDINRWQETITPRDTSKPWIMGPGGSFDMQDVQPIPDAMLAELAKLYNSHGCPWNCRSLPLSPGDREYMYLLYYSMQGLVARMRQAERKAADVEASAARAFQIADEAMYELLIAEGVPGDSPAIDATVFGLVDENCQEVTALADASAAMREAFDWLKERGYVELGSDSSGEFINVRRRPGEDA